MQDYRILLKNEKFNSYNRLGYFMLAILILLYIFLAFFTGNDLTNTNKIITLSFIGIMIFVKVFYPQRVKRTWLGMTLFFMAVGFSFLQYYWIAIACFSLGLLLLNAIKEKFVHFTSSYIKYPSFPGRTINWSELNNCLLKDSLLTIDLKNNRVIQQLIDEKTGSVNEKEFNEFCREQLAAAKTVAKAQ